MKTGKYPLLAAFLLPALGLYGYFVIAPYAQAFVIALTDSTGYSSRFNWVGLDNFKWLFTNEHFRTALWHNALLLLLLPVITIALGLFLASMLNIGGGNQRRVGGVRGSSFYKIVYFVPQVLSVAVIGVLWKEIYNPRSGLLNSGLKAVGLEGLASNNLGDPDRAFWLLLAVMVWSNAGFYVVLFGAAMMSIPRDIYEAAAIDGTTRWNTMWRITLPLVWDTIQVAWVYLAIIALDGFALVQIMTRGGPNSATDVAGYQMYTEGITDGNFGRASAMGVTLFFFTLTITLVALRLSRRERVELA